MAEARSVERLLNPGSIAVIGAGRMPGGLGHEVFRHLVSHGFDGPVYPVNPHGGHVASVRAYPSVLDVIDEVDLAIVAVPAARVADVVDECARKRVRGLVIISAGLDDLEVDGTSGSKFIVERALRSGMRVIGPESMGIINTAAGVSMHSTFAEVHVTPGGVGFLTESGTLGAAALEHAHRMGVGISAFVDIGARTDVSGNDLLQFWETDDRTSVVLLYMESFGNPRKFTRIARRMTRSKPIVAVKSGRGRPAPGAPGEDDAALAAMWPADATVGALLAQSGVIRVDTPAELFNMARVLVHQPVPHGRRVAVISNSNGASVLTTDACTGAGLEIPGLTAATRDALAGQVPPDASLVNPIDLTWEAGPDEYEAAVRAALADDEIDAAIVVYAPPIRERWVDVARAIGTAQSEQDAKPVLATFLGAEIGLPFVSGARAVPLFEFPDEAARVLGHMAEYAAWRSQPEGSTIRLDDSELEPLRGFVSGVLEINPDGCWLDRADTDRLFGLAGLRVAAHRLVRTCAEAVEAANEIGWPVALKATGVERYHRGEGGGVALDLHEDAALVAAHDRMVAALGEAMEIALVQEMVPPGVDVMVAAHQNASFGAVISIGIGGVMAPANRDLGVRVLPLSDTDGTRLIAASPVSALLEQEDAHGDATRAATELLTRLGAVVDQVPEIADVLLNPVIVGGTGACIVDALVRIAPYGVENLPEVRRLT